MRLRWTAVLLLLCACGDHRALPSAETSSGSGVSSMGEDTGPVTTGPMTTSTTDWDSSDSEADGDLEGGGVFVPDLPDDGIESCNINAEYNECPEGFKCLPYSDYGSGWFDGMGCFPMVEAPAPLYGECEWLGDGSWLSGGDTCGEYAWCRNVDPETGKGQCIGICRGPWNGSSEPQVCEDEKANPFVGCQECFCECMPNCDPLAQDCPDNQACLLNYNDGFMCALDASGELGQVGDACAYANACDPGNLCIDGEAMPPELCTRASSGCCSAFCDIGNDECETLAPGTICQTVLDPAPVGYEHVGACMVQP